MKTDGYERLDRLFRLARTAGPDAARAEFGLETRVLARLRAGRKAAAPWHALSWRLMPLFAALVVSLGGWYYAAMPYNHADLRTAITADYEQAVSLGEIMGG